jgi:hypothetical protein
VQLHGFRGRVRERAAGKRDAKKALDTAVGAATTCFVAEKTVRSNVPATGARRRARSIAPPIHARGKRVVFRSVAAVPAGRAAARGHDHFLLPAGGPGV